MAPNLEDQKPESPHTEPNDDSIYLTLTPLSDLSVATTPSEGNHSESESASEIVEPPRSLTFLNDQRNYLPLEHNLRELLVIVTNTENLDTVTQIKLRVITRDVALQQLAVYVPALRELTLDGSVVFSLRDLGNGLRNLKILRVNRCQLTCIDGVLGLEDLEELHAANNEIKDLSPCAFLSNLKIIDVRWNAIKNFGSLSFLNLCEDLKHLLLQGNAAVDELLGYRQIVKRILPHLEMLDDLPLDQDATFDTTINDIIIEDIEEDEARDARIQETVVSYDDLLELLNVGLNIMDNKTFTPRRSASLSWPNPTSSEAINGFTVRFPPKVCNGNRGESL